MRSAATAFASRSNRESASAFAVGVGQNLDRDVAVELRVPRTEDLSHPARAEGREDLVRPEPCPGGETHRFLGGE